MYDFRKIIVTFISVEIPVIEKTVKVTLNFGKTLKYLLANCMPICYGAYVSNSTHTMVLRGPVKSVASIPDKPSCQCYITNGGAHGSHQS